MAELKPYEEYKEVDLPWLERIPSHWDQRKIKYLFEERVEKGYSDETLLAATQTKGVVPKDMYENRTVVAQKDLHLLKLVKKGDFVISLRSFQGGIEYAYYQGIISPAYTIMIPRNEIAYGFFKHLGKSRLFIELLKLCVTGIREGQNIDYNVLKNSMISLPPKDEQDQIAKFLDNSLSKIDRFITAKKKQIELLKELKQAIINQAVTKGIDPDVPMKDSGVEWIGEIPEHWEVTQVGKVYDILLGKMLQPNKENDNDTLQNYICSLNVFWEKITLHNIKTMWFSSSEIHKYRLKKGDLIVVEGGNVAVSHIWNGYIDKCFIQNAVHRVREIKLGKNEFLYYWLYCLKKQGYIDLICNKATFAHFTKKKFSRLFLFLPPLAEQVEIINYIKMKSTVIDKAIDSIQKQIDLVKEYRTSLISAVVTGKVDVRHIPVGNTDEPVDDSVEEMESKSVSEEGLEYKEV